MADSTRERMAPPTSNILANWLVRSQGWVADGLVR